ncbi:hypothetical protein NN561_012741 [Cricetulus griseus]
MHARKRGAAQGRAGTATGARSSGGGGGSSEGGGRPAASAAAPGWAGQGRLRAAAQPSAPSCGSSPRLPSRRLRRSLGVPARTPAPSPWPPLQSSPLPFSLRPGHLALQSPGLRFLPPLQCLRQHPPQCHMLESLLWRDPPLPHKLSCGSCSSTGSLFHSESSEEFSGFLGAL